MRLFIAWKTDVVFLIDSRAFEYDRIDRYRINVVLFGYNQPLLGG